MEIAWTPTARRNLARINESIAASRTRAHNPALVQAVVRAHAWLRLLSDGTYDSIEVLAAAVDMHPKVVRARIRLAFMSPTLIQAAFAGELADMNAAAPFSWIEQHHGVQRHALGSLAPPTI